MITTADLLPCPNCDTADDLVIVDTDPYLVCCHECDLSAFGKSTQEAVSKWNGCVRDT